MTPDYYHRIYLALAPPGVWSSGPVVVGGETTELADDAAKAWRGMGWTVLGPYAPLSDCPAQP